MTRVLERSRPLVSVLDFTPQEITSFLRFALSADFVKEAYVFGSFVEGKLNPWSDLDLLIVADTELPFLERPRQFAKLNELGVPVDVLVYTKDEFDALKISNSGFWKSFQKCHLRLM